MTKTKYCEKCKRKKEYLTKTNEHCTRAYCCGCGMNLGVITKHKQQYKMKFRGIN